jgi:hypothetical protein
MGTTKLCSPGPTALWWRPGAHDLPQCDDLTQVMGVVDCDMGDRVGQCVVRERRKLDRRVDAADTGGHMNCDFLCALQTLQEPFAH